MRKHGFTLIELLACRPKLQRRQVRTAFTLIELLVVIAIIALLVSILLPSLNRAKDLARRAVCAANLNGLGKSLSLYMTENDAAYPWIYNSNIRGSVSTGTNRDTAPSSGSTLDRNFAAPSFLLVREGQGTKSFICPSTDDEADEDPTHSSGGEELYAWDFNGPENTSYSYAGPRELLDGSFTSGVSVEAPSGAAIMSDRGPYSSSDAGGDSTNANTWNPSLTGDDLAKHVSQNHNAGEFMNVLFVDGHVGGANRPDIGVNEDHIFTAYGDAENDAQTATGLFRQEHHQDADSYLVGPN